MAYLEHALAELDASVARTGKFVFGTTPSIADFSVYHNIWFLKNNPVNAPLLDAYPGVESWCERMSALRHGEVEESDGQAALDAAKACEPVVHALEPSPAWAFAPGDSVSVTPIDYGCIPVAGTLVGASHDEVVIERSTIETGTVHNHFPQAGFDVRRA